MKHILTYALLPLCLAVPALADDMPTEVDPDIRPLTQCGPFGELLKTLDEFEELDADRRDVVDIRPNARFLLKDGAPLPTRVFLKSGEQEADLAVTPAGYIPDAITTLRTLGKDTELCITDPHFAGTARSEPGRNFNMGMLPQYLNETGNFTLAELKEGGSDGRKFFKKMVPGAVSMFVPKLRHVAVSHPDDDPTQLPTVTAFAGDQELGPVTMEPFDVSQLMSLEALEEMGADRITVTGAHTLFPMPDAKVIKKYMSPDDE